MADDDLVNDSLLFEIFKLFNVWLNHNIFWFFAWKYLALKIRMVKELNIYQSGAFFFSLSSSN